MPETQRAETIMTVQSSIFLGLLDMIPDRDLRERIREQYFHDVEAQTSFVQTRIGQLELDLRDQVSHQIGSTNDMISEVLDITRRQEGVVTELRGEFRHILENVRDMRGDVHRIDVLAAHHEEEIASFRISRDQSIAERRQFQDDHDESKADRAAIHKELQQATIERQHMADALRRIEEMLHNRPSSEEAQRLIETLHETVRRVDALEQRERRSNEA